MGRLNNYGLFLQGGLEAVAGALEEGGDGVGGDAEEAGDLGIRKAVAVVEPEDQALAGREGFESGGELSVALGAEEFLEGSGGGGGRWRGIAGAFAPEVEEGLAAGDADQPGGEGTQAPEGAEEAAVVLEEFGEDFLGDVLGGGSGGGATEDGGGGADEEGRELAGEPFPGDGIVGEESLDDRKILHGGH